MSSAILQLAGKSKPGTDCVGPLRGMTEGAAAAESLIG